MLVDLSKLNKAQKEAVTHGDGPAILVAGAGTGKTTVVTSRVAWLIAEGKAKPEEILAVTFTDKAAAEMEERVDRLLPLGYVELWVQTFHAFCQRILHEHALDIGLPNEFKILDQTATWILVRNNLEQFDLDYYKPLGNPTRFIHALVDHFSRCKDEGIYPEDYVHYAEEQKLDTGQAGDREELGRESKRIAELANAYHAYQRLLLQNNVLDFGDLINYALKLFRERPAILERYRAQFKYILVDEFQDTNWAQYELVKMLAAPRNNLMVVGDDDQSIYKFRGASFSNILLFKKDFPAAREIYLTDNYRSGQRILDRAYQFIRLNNPDRLEVKLGKGKTKLSKKLISRTAASGEVSVLSFRTADDEVRGVIETIRGLKERDKDFSWNDIAILVRANEQAQRFVRSFRAANIPHLFLAAKGLYSQELIITILSYLRLLDNYHESEALYRVLSLPAWSIVPEDIIEMNHLAARKSWSLWRTITSSQAASELAAESRKGIDRFTALVREHTKLARTVDPSVLIYRFLDESGQLELLTLEDNQYNREQLRFLNLFYKKVRTWEEENLEGGVKEFVDFINLELESGERGSLEHDIEEGPEQVTISTIHSAKGLEYKYVFIVGVVHLRFPTRERRDPIEIPKPLIKDILPEGDAHLQEERRLMYVALTRARDRVFISFARDYGGVMQKKPSRFIEELGFPSADGPSADGVLVEPRTASGALVLPQEPTLAALKYRLPSKFSFTQLRAFQTCPKQYHYAHIIKIPAAGRAVFSFGKIIHRVLQKFFVTVSERAGRPQGSLFEDKKPRPRKPVSLDELMKLYHETWEEDWFFDEENKRKYKERGREMLRGFYAALGDTIPVPVALEQPFTMKLKDVSFKGAIDRIDEIEHDGKKWKIIDYKTGEPPRDDKLSFQEKEQLLIYQIAAREVFRKDVGTLALYFLDSQKMIEFVGTDAELTRVKQSIIETVEKIRQSDFAPTPGFWCRSCDYRYICPAAQL